MPAEIKVMSAGAVQSMVKALGAEFERATGNKLDLIFNTAGSLRDRFKGGEAADLVDPAAGEHRRARQSPACSCPAASPISAAPSPAWRCARARPCRTFPRRRPSSRRCSRRKAVAYTDPKAGGSSGIYFAGSVGKARHRRCGEQKGRARQARLRGGPGGRRRPRRDRHHLHQRNPHGEGRQGGRARCRANCTTPTPIPPPSRPAARPAMRPWPCCARSPIRPPPRAGPRPAWSRPSLRLAPGFASCILRGARGALPNYACDREAPMPMDQLKFVVLDEEDLEVVSTHLQDAVVKVVRRAVAPAGKAPGGGAQPLRLGRRAIRHSRNTAGGGRRCASSGFCRANAGIVNPAGKDAVLNLLAVEFAETDAPSGVVTLIFSGGAPCGWRSSAWKPNWPISGRPGPRPPARSMRWPRIARRRPAAAERLPQPARDAALNSVQNSARDA